MARESMAPAPSSGHALTSTAPRRVRKPSKFLTCPNEIFDQIFEYLFVDMTEETRRSHLLKKHILTRPHNSVNLGRTPAFMMVCTKLRKHCMPIFLARVDIVVDVSPRKLAQPAGYNRCINTLSRLGVENVRRIKSLTIVNNKPGYPFQKVDLDFSNLIDIWNTFIPSLLRCGIQAQQFRWPGLCPLMEQLRNPPWERWEEQVRDQTKEGPANFNYQVLQLAIIYLGIVEPTLQEFNCLCPQHPLANVLQQALDLELFDKYDKDANVGIVARKWKILNNKRWEMKYGVTASEHHFEDLTRGPGKQSYALGQTRDAYRDWNHGWHAWKPKNAHEDCVLM